jgi:hypothetical protein
MGGVKRGRRGGVRKVGVRKGRVMGKVRRGGVTSRVRRGGRTRVRRLEIDARLKEEEARYGRGRGEVGGGGEKWCVEEEDKKEH